MIDSDKYRKQAVESFHARDEFQHAIQIITPKAWIYLIVFLMIFISCMLWLIFGRMSTIVDGQGMIFARNSEIINVMSPISGGFVKDLLVVPGERIRKGQLIAILVNPNMSVESKELSNYISEQKAKLKELNETAKKEIDTRIKNIQESINYANKIAANLKEKEANLGALLKVHEAAFKKGILSKIELTNIQIAYYGAKEQITKNQNTLVELNQSKNDYIESWNIKIRDLQEKLGQSEFNLKKIQGIQLTENVLSPVAGVISTNYVKKGDFLSEKQTLTNIITFSNSLEVIGFFNADVGKKIKVGMSAKVFPKHFNPLEYGGLVGKVIFVSELPINPAGIENLLEDKQLVSKFLHSGPVFKVKIELVPTDETVSGYVWTTSKGPKEKLSIGSVANLEILIKKERPLSVIIPIVKSAKNWMINKND